MKLTFTKADPFEWAHDDLKRLEVDVVGAVRLARGDLCVTVDQRIDALGGGLFRAGDAFATYDEIDDAWTLAGGTHWSDVVVGDA